MTLIWILMIVAEETSDNALQNLDLLLKEPEVLLVLAVVVLIAAVALVPVLVLLPVVVVAQILLGLQQCLIMI
jgi:hypothetical protein